MRSLLIALAILSMALPAFMGCSDSGMKKPPQSSQQGEVVTPTIEGDLIKVNNKICPMSKNVMDEKTLGTFTGRVAYNGKNPKYQGKTFEFNYCCAMCQNSFPKVFEEDADNVLKFHGL